MEDSPQQREDKTKQPIHQPPEKSSSPGSSSLGQLKKENDAQQSHREDDDNVASITYTITERPKDNEHADRNEDNISQQPSNIHEKVQICKAPSTDDTVRIEDNQARESEINQLLVCKQDDIHGTKLEGKDDEGPSTSDDLSGSHAHDDIIEHEPDVRDHTTEDDALDSQHQVHVHVKVHGQKQISLQSQQSDNQTGDHVHHGITEIETEGKDCETEGQLIVNKSLDTELENKETYEPTLDSKPPEPNGKEGHIQKNDNNQVNQEGNEYGKESHEEVQNIKETGESHEEVDNQTPENDTVPAEKEELHVEEPQVHDIQEERQISKECSEDIECLDDTKDLKEHILDERNDIEDQTEEIKQSDDSKGDTDELERRTEDVELKTQDSGEYNESKINIKELDVKEDKVVKESDKELEATGITEEPMGTVEEKDHSAELERGEVTEPLEERGDEEEAQIINDDHAPQDISIKPAKTSDDLSTTLEMNVAQVGLLLLLLLALEPL